jgi:hypothetical protein
LMRCECCFVLLNECWFADGCSPYTINGKKVEIAIKKIISGLDVKVSSTVTNPGSLKKYEQFKTVERARATKI